MALQSRADSDTLCTRSRPVCHALMSMHSDLSIWSKTYIHSHSQDWQSVKVPAQSVSVSHACLVVCVDESLSFMQCFLAQFCIQTFKTIHENSGRKLLLSIHTNDSNIAMDTIFEIAPRGYDYTHVLMFSEHLAWWCKLLGRFR